MAKTILIKPLITEKSEKLSNGLNRYSFLVANGVNKIEIRKAIEETYGVKVSSVNTLVMPSKAKVRSSRSGAMRGRVAAFKKAVVTLPEGEQIDYFGEI